MTLRPSEESFKFITDQLRVKYQTTPTNKSATTSEYCHIKNLEYNNETKEEAIERRRRENMQRDAYFLKTSPNKETVFAVKYAETKNIGLGNGYDKQTKFLSKECNKNLRNLENYTFRLQEDLASIRTKNIREISQRGLKRLNNDTSNEKQLPSRT